MVVGSLDLKTVSLRYGVLILKQQKDMTLFQITHQELYYKNASNTEQGLRMLIRLKRKVMSEMMTTYFPSILLMLITFATTIFKDEYFEASLSVNLTTMLVMTTIFISKMEGLPPTSDIKMIDIWLIFCQLVPFSEVVLLTAIEYLREDQNDNETTNIGSKIQKVWEGPERQRRNMYLLILKTVGRCHLLAPPSGALVVSQFQDPVQSSPSSTAFRFGCSSLLPIMIECPNQIWQSVESQ